MFEKIEAIRSGYMGWHSTYAQQYGGLGSNMTESFLHNQADWLANNFKSYGYNYLCIDGWVGSASRHNSDGYVTTFNDSWTGGWAEMASYVHSKGLKFGMYYNPGWVLKSIADDTTNKIVGTDYPIKSITDSLATFGGWYEIDVSKPGAEQYVKGFVNYLISCGVDLLKVDYLNSFENHYGHTAAMTLERWIREAAGNNLMITLSMPQGINHLQDERNYGDNIRVVEDYNKNGWIGTSSRNRGKIYDTWPLADNVFDGLCWFSDITGEDKFIPSPDYYTFHDSATDDEKKFAAGIRFISGAAVEFGDSYNDIGGDANANFLRNSELTALNADGFVGKPLTRTLTDARSQIWQGTTSNGDRVVALFNREDSAQTRSVDFYNDLGLSGSHNVRDLWTHQNLGMMSSYSISVPAYGAVVIRIYVGNTPPPNGDPNPPAALIPVSGGGIVSGQTYTLKSHMSSLFLDNWNSTTDGTLAGQYTYNGGNTQLWTITDVGGGYYTLVNQMSGKALDNGNTTTNGTHVMQWTPNGNSTQKWKIVNVSGFIYTLQSEMSGLNLDNGNSTSIGQSILQWTPNGNTTQQWVIQ